MCVREADQIREPDGSEGYPPHQFSPLAFLTTGQAGRLGRM
jgi:hypothetical protein